MGTRRRRRQERARGPRVPSRTARPALVAALGLLALAASSCGAPDRPGRSREVRELLTHEPASFSLVGKSDYHTERLAALVTEGLVQFDPDLTLVPRVAESWEVSDDHRAVTFHLRDGVRWHDGKPVTAADVAFTVAQVRDPAVESRTWLPLFRDVAEVEVLDERTVRARYTVATPDFLEAWRVPLLPRHLAESGAELLTGGFQRKPVGCGPFRFLRHVPGEEIVLEANADYWDGRPRLDRLVLRLLPDQRTALRALVAGDLDLMVASWDLWREALDADRERRLASFVYYRTSVWIIRWNQAPESPLFRDPSVRRAMMLALDRERYVERMLGGLGRVAATTYHPDLPWTDRELAPLPYDPAAAERLLDEAGWRRPRPGAPREREGRPFRFTLLTAASTQQIVDHTAAWLQQSWAEIGVETTIEKLDWSVFFERLHAGRYEAAMSGLSTTPSPDQYELYHSTMREAGVNSMAFADPEVDALLERGRESFDPSERRAIYHRLQRRLLELQPVGCLMHFATVVLHDRRLRGVEASPIDYWRTTRGPRLWSWSEED